MIVTDHRGISYFFTQKMKSAECEDDVITVVNPYNIVLTFWKASSGKTMLRPDLGGALSDFDFEHLKQHLEIKC